MLKAQANFIFLQNICLLTFQHIGHFQLHEKYLMLSTKGHSTDLYNAGHNNKKPNVYKVPLFYIPDGSKICNSKKVMKLQNY